MRGLIALASGLLFGFGLLISGMANPAKVLPSGASCGHVTSLGRVPEGMWI